MVATCVTEDVPVMINSTSLKIPLAKLTKQTVVTELTKTLYQADSVLTKLTVEHQPYTKHSVLTRRSLDKQFGKSITGANVPSPYTRCWT